MQKILKYWNQLKSLKMDRKQWFIDRIGKRVFNTMFCDCACFLIVYDAGMVINDRFEAIASYDLESDLQAEGTKLKYFDTKEERTIYETENNLSHE